MERTFGSVNRASDEVQAEHRSQDRSDEGHVLAGKRVVICEDEAVTQMQLRRILTRAHLIIAGTAIDGQTAIEVVLRERPDLVLMDIEMPIMSGLEAARRVMDVYPVCMVMLTAYGEESYREQAAEVGASNYLIKPIMGDSLLPELVQAMNRYIRRQRTES